MKSNHKNEIFKGNFSNCPSFNFWGEGQMAFTAIKRINELKAKNKNEDLNSFLKEWSN
tara:strand:- start:844 stop:1017 length:174 start_codon:yes stop_codon:yes gene_type:complete